MYVCVMKITAAVKKTVVPVMIIESKLIKMIMMGTEAGGRSNDGGGAGDDNC